MTYDQLQQGDYFLINGYRFLPKRKTADGYVDLVSGEVTRDRFMIDAIRIGFDYQKITATEVNDIKVVYNLSFAAITP